MDGPKIDQKIRFGYAKAAKKLGQNFDLYRPPTPIDPLNIANKIGVIKAVMTVDWTWMKSNKPGNAIWFCCIDGQDSSDPLSAHENDYLVGDTTFFVLSKEYQLPIQVVECNCTIQINRPYQDTTKGKQDYAAYRADEATLVMSLLPASMLIRREGMRAKSKLPTDTNQPTWMVQLPNIANVDLRTGDIITLLDDMFAVPENPETFVIGATEETEFGWRLIASQEVN